MKKTKITLFAILIVVVVLVIAIVIRPDQYHTPERIEWKNNAITELSLIELSEGIPDIKFTHDGWFSEQALLMGDGSWIAFRYFYNEGDSRIYDIFIGRGSNGNWYYSTYHFCIGCYNILDEQPDSLSAFIDQCALVEFDGESDDCLLPTWPPE